MSGICALRCFSRPIYSTKLCPFWNFGGSFVPLKDDSLSPENIIYPVTLTRRDIPILNIEAKCRLSASSDGHFFGALTHANSSRKKLATCSLLKLRMLLHTKNCFLTHFKDPCVACHSLAHSYTYILLELFRSLVQSFKASPIHCQSSLQEKSLIFVNQNCIKK